MCGFTVLLKKKKIDITDRFQKASEIISYRGPDDTSFYEDENIAFNFFRLSIQDLSTHGRQPMISNSKRYIIVFNGEIYNKLQLRVKFNFRNLKSNSDTEIILKLFEKLNNKCLDHLDGMFSFVIYDKLRNEVFLARDRFGIKPLYYYESKNYIFFSSEIKPILKFKEKFIFNNQQIFDFFLRQRMDHENQTFFSDILALPPSFYGKIKKNYEIKLFKYWNINANTEKNISEKVVSIK